MAFGRKLLITNIIPVILVLFYYLTHNASPFRQGAMWAAHVARLGYSWKVGDGKGVSYGSIDLYM